MEEVTYLSGVLRNTSVGRKDKFRQQAGEYRGPVRQMGTTSNSIWPT